MKGFVEFIEVALTWRNVIKYFIFLIEKFIRGEIYKEADDGWK